MRTIKCFILSFALLASILVISSCNGGGEKMNITIQFSEEEAFRSLAYNSSDSNFIKIMDKAIAVKQQYPDSSVVELFFNTWQNETPQAWLAPVFASFELREHIRPNDSNNDVTRTIRRLMGERLSDALQKVEWRLDYLGCKITGPFTSKDREVQELLFSTSGGAARRILELENVKSAEMVRKAITTKGHFEVFPVHSHLDLLAANPELTEYLDFNANIIPLPYAVVKSADVNKVKELLARTDLPRDLKIVWNHNPNNDNYSLFLLQVFRDGNGILNNDVINSVDVEKADDNYQVVVSFNAEGSKIWERATQDLAGLKVAITIDGRVYSAPAVVNKITDGKLPVGRNFTKQAAEEMVVILKTGALPVNCEIIKEELITK